jgi:hypothetical protein
VADAADSITLNGTTLLLKGPIAGKPVSELLSGLRIGRANYDDRQHAFYIVIDDFSAGFGHHNLDIREALGTHWDNPGGVDLRRSRHITLPPKRYRVAADTDPTKMQFSAEVLDGAAVGIPADSNAAGISSYLYLGAGDSVYRMNEARTSLALVAKWVASGAAGKEINMASSITPPTKMTRMFLYRSPSDRVRRLYVITIDAGAAGATSRYFFTGAPAGANGPGAATPDWNQGVRFLWDAIPATVSALGGRAIVAQETTFRFMFSTDPLKVEPGDNGDLTDWTIDASTPQDPLWIPNSVCRFIGQAAAYWSSNVPALYFIDYGDGGLYGLDIAQKMAFHIPIGNFHYLLNGVIWNGFVAVTDGTDVWLYSASGGETVRKIGIFDKDGVPDSFRDGRYRITGLVDGGRFLYAIAEYANSGTLGFMVLVYNGTGWSLFSKPVEVTDTTATHTANPIAAFIDRFPADVAVAVSAQTPISRALDVLCHAKPALVGPATDIAFVDGAGGADTITRTAGGLDIFEAGDTIEVFGSTSNDGGSPYTIVSVVAGTITLATGTLAAEGAGQAVTIVRTSTLQIQLHSHMLPAIGHIPIDGIDEFAGNEDTVEGSNDDHEFITGWMDGGFRDISGVLHHLKIDMQEALAGSRVIVSYRLDDDETAGWTELGTASARGSTTMQFDTAGDNNGIEFRTVQFKFNVTRIHDVLLDGGINDSVQTITVDETDDMPSVGVLQIEDEVIEYTGKTTDPSAETVTGATRGARGTAAAAHDDDKKVYSLNRTPEMRAATLVYAKKAPLRQTWVGEIDVNALVEKSATGGWAGVATHQKVYDWLKSIRDMQTLVKLVIPQKESGIMVQIADYTVVADDYRDAATARDTIPITFLEPVRA